MLTVGTAVVCSSDRVTDLEKLRYVLKEVMWILNECVKVETVASHG